MIRERDKARKILNVIIEYFVLHKFKNISANINIDDKTTNINILGTIDANSIDITKLKEELDYPRIFAYDDYYDGLLDSDSEDELKVIGYLIDQADINLVDNELTINLVRKHM